MMIESLQNPRVKALFKLQQKSRERKESGQFLVEGVQENRLALASNYESITFLICEDFYQNDIPIPKGVEVVRISKRVFEKLAYRKTTGGIIGIYKTKKHAIPDFKPTENGIYLVLEGIEKPGNLGAIFRSCDGAGVAGVFINGKKADLYNPNTLRGSVGTLFNLPIYIGSPTEINAKLTENNVSLFATYLGENTPNLYHAKWKGSVAFVMGTEATGISKTWLDLDIPALKIPMLGMVDSLNVGIASALCIYEARRRILA